MSEHHSHVLTPVSWVKHTQTGIERSVMTFFLSAVISVLQYTTALMWCLIKSQKTFSFIPSTHIFKYLRNNLLGKVKVRLWMFKNLEHFQRQCQTGNKTQTRGLFGLCGVRLGRESNRVRNQRNGILHGQQRRCSSIISVWSWRNKEHPLPK